MRPLADYRTPHNKLTEEECQLILDVCNSPEFADLPPNIIVPSLADNGIYIASESSFYRVLKANRQLADRSRSKGKGSYKKPNSQKATTPNQVWSWDISYLPATVKGRHFYLYLIMDIFSRKIVGSEVHEQELGSHAADLLQRAIWSEKCVTSGIVLHSDNGAPMRSYTMLGKMQELGVISSYSRPRVSNDNPFSESLFRTIKYCPAWPSNGFESLLQARNWVDKFTHWYNHEHKHSGIKYVTPADRHNGKDAEILSQRKSVYQAARARNPERWRHNLRNWDFIDEVLLNPDKKAA